MRRRSRAVSLHLGAALADTAADASAKEEEELDDALLGEPSLLLSLCHTYAQDAACLSAQYVVPEACRELLGVEL